MRELNTFTPDVIDESRRVKLMLLVCDEGSINCATIRKLQESIAKTGLGAVLIMPDYQYKKGLRGWAKAQILTSVVNQLEGVMALDYETAQQELGKNWASVQINGPVTWSSSEKIIPQETNVSNLKIIETTDAFDKAMIDRAKKIVATSNCWQDPAGCVFVKDGEVLVESASTNFNQSRCTEIPINFGELELNPGERMMFCDSLHAERVAVTEASKKGVSLEKSSAYVTKFPCRPCMLSLISVGVKTIVFDRESYGLLEVEDLVQANEIVLKRIRD